MSTTRRTMLRTLLASSAALAAPACGAAARPRDRVRSTDELVVGPGGWCWFQSPRAAIDDQGRLWLGSTQGTGGPTPGSVDVTQVDLDRLLVVGRHPIGRDRVDDHTAPSVSSVDGRVEVGWAPHRPEDWLELGTLGEPLQRIHRPGSLVEPGRGMSYVSAHRVGGEQWALYRGEGFTWNLLTSRDGRSWTPRGAVIRPVEQGQRPYLLAASDGERLHIVVSDGNPTETRGCGVGAAVIEGDRTIHDGVGKRLGMVGDSAPTTVDPQRLFEGRAGSEPRRDVNGWMCDLAIADGRPTALLSVRGPRPSGTDGPGQWSHRYLWARQQASGRWIVEPLGPAGSELYAHQPDYCGLGTIDPSDSRRVVVSTDVHPVSGVALRSTVDGKVHHELFEGRRANQTWTWTPLTRNSIEDNLRPVLVDGGQRSVLAWMRGTYRAWSDFDTQIVLRIA